LKGPGQSGNIPFGHHPADSGGRELRSWGSCGERVVMRRGESWTPAASARK
jgi:hypothetical protein